jgi:aminoglycoside phosphotransferase (APT) family kinase protein
MTGGRLHVDEVDIDADLVARLIAEQFPAWQGLRLAAVESDGTDNAIYRLGGDMAVRLPRYPAAAFQIDKEREWLPRLAPHLPLAIPQPLATGAPDHGYPFHWSVCRWIAGENALLAPVDSLDEAARSLAEFIRVLREISPVEAPKSGRGVPLAERDGRVRQAINELDGIVDTNAVTRIWEEALNAPEWMGKPLWIHGDIHPGNVIVAGGKATAVIDFGCICTGDPACDLQLAWTFLDRGSREIFRSHLAADDAAWTRGKGWALSVALIALPYYMRTNPTIVGTSRRAIAEILSER